MGSMRSKMRGSMRSGRSKMRTRRSGGSTTRAQTLYLHLQLDQPDLMRMSPKK